MKDNIISPSTYIHPSTSIGDNGFSFKRNDAGFRSLIPSEFGVVIGHSSYIASHCNVDAGIKYDTVIGSNVIIDSHVHISHDCIIGHNVEIDVGAIILGECTIGDFTRICAGAIIHQKTTVGRNCVVGAKSYLRHDLSDGKVAYGIPAIVVDGSNYDKVRYKPKDTQ